MRPLVRDVVACVGFYTRLPVPRGAAGAAAFASASWASPLAGAAVGLCGAGVHFAAGALGLPVMPAAALALASTVLVTGALHEDGLADTADGFGGGRTLERKLEIMRDSRLGTYGACALLMSMLLRWSTLVALAEPYTVAVALVAGHAAARSTIPAFMRWTPLARTGGLAAGAGAPPLISAVASLALGAVALLPTGPAAFLASASLVPLWALLLRRLALRQIGGHTGDVLGCLEQGGEILVLLTVAAAIRA